MASRIEIMLDPKKYGYVQCTHCNGYGSSFKRLLCLSQMGLGHRETKQGIINSAWTGRYRSRPVFNVNGLYFYPD